VRGRESGKGERMRDELAKERGVQKIKEWKRGTKEEV
jgi:hypothetical protein